MLLLCKVREAQKLPAWDPTCAQVEMSSAFFKIYALGMVKISTKQSLPSWLSTSRFKCLWLENIRQVLRRLLEGYEWGVNEYLRCKTVMTFPRHLRCNSSWKYYIHIKASPDFQVSEVRKSLKTLYMSKMTWSYLLLAGKKNCLSSIVLSNSTDTHRSTTAVLET